MLTLRGAVISDLPLLFRGEHAYIVDHEPDALEGWFASTEKRLGQWIDNLPHLHVAEVDGAAAGYCLWYADGESAVLAALHTEPHARRQGVGHALLHRFETHAVSQGFSVLSLGVLPGNPARRLYERAGYRFVCAAGRYHHLVKNIHVKA
jgi:ribosomal protein S18 acetylase RimI-like enzyme